ncbi:MAG: hypothetical protein OXL41_08870 [Nitrospinae bacterium]|nr:hypothetical protein [Nitrospinota bacterium]
MAAFSRAGERLETEGIKVVSASTDPEVESLQSIEAGKVNFPVGHSLDPARVSEVTGAFYAPERARSRGRFFTPPTFCSHPTAR